MFVYFHIFVFGLEYALLWFLIEFRSFRLLIHLISSPNNVATLLFVLIRWVDFIVIFRDDFSTIFQSCVVFVVHERVTVRNPKTDSKSEFGYPRYGWRTEGACERSGWPWGRPWAPRPEGLSAPVRPTRPYGLGWCGLTWLARNPFSLLLLFPSSLSIWFSRRKNWKIPSVFSSTFSHLPNIISPSSGVRFEWFELENVRNWVLYHFQAVW